MLEKIREGATGITAKIILGLVILSFIFAGVGGYINSDVETAVADVNGEEIGLSTFEQAFQSERSRMEAQLGDAFSQLASNEEYLSSFRDSVLTRLINDKLLEQKSQELGIRVSDSELRKTILNMNEFSVGGQFNNERYQAILLQAGFSAEDFRAYMRNQLTRQQFSNAVLSSEFALESEASQFLSIQNETRDARSLELDIESFKEGIEISEQEVTDFYQANLAQFDTQEKVSVQYVEVKVDDFMADAIVDEEQVELYYEEQQNVYRTEKQVRASHILLEFGDDEAAAKEKADSVLTSLRNGQDFAELAKVESQDTFSGENGGDLDWFGEGVMDPDFEAAAFALTNVGELSDVVRSEFGFHIIKLTDLKAESIQPLEEVRDDIVQALMREEAEREFFEMQESMGQLAFEVSDSLDDVAALMELEVLETPMFSRNLPPAPFDNGNLLIQAFSEELIADGVNSEVIALNDDSFVILRIAEHEEERTKLMSEVQVEIEDTLYKEKALDSALLWLEDLVVDLDAGDNVDEKLLSKGLQWNELANVGRYSSDLSRQLNSELFKLSKLNEARTVELSDSKVGLIQLLVINLPDEAATPEVDATKQRLSQSNGQDSFSVLIEAVSEEADVIKTL